jgi:hypothetical protein
LLDIRRDATARIQFHPVTAGVGTLQRPHEDTAKVNEDVKIQRSNQAFAGMLVIVGFLQAGIMFLQWRTYHRQAGIMEQQREMLQSQWTTMQAQLSQAAQQTQELKAAADIGLVAAQAAVENAKSPKSVLTSLLAWHSRN